MLEIKHNFVLATAKAMRLSTTTDSVLLFLGLQNKNKFPF